ncbi:MULTISPECIES: hypothetical protein [Brevibacillus]|uniref:hypothetical protein n=1 Tax=Brevibacillus TaxID=55080 RepID=UPI000D0E6827|nr:MULTISPECIES: hypothetical protein [Brevibacillus]PSJ66980.1 hypothetical protein C7J99_23135 [Brevibacillus brevis]RED27741.1 hypothetical protein DES34_10933 [Brevibacillus brevis]TQK42107.1 hypothetical protein FB479_11599 [Brevibacillus sp. AG162]VEF86778.1 Uncharacterised protein [Brevibacillus brevis]GEC88581.1 hypothetical protein BBR01nite_09120 [Brevibacillus brevis]
MIFIRHESPVGGKAKVLTIHYLPEEIGINNAADAENAGGVLVPTVPTPDNIAGKEAVLYFNPTTKEFSYEYVDKPLTQDEKIAQLEQQLKITQDALDALLLA